MATSGTRQFSMDYDEITSQAMAIAGGEPSDAFLVRYSKRAANLLLLDWQARGLGQWNYTSTTAVLSASVGTYSLPSDCIDVTEVMYRDDSSGSNVDTALGRLSRSEYAQLSGKAQSGRPSSFWVDRQASGATLYVWPVPDTASVESLYYWYIRRTEDVTGFGENVGIPDRFLMAFIYGLAFQYAQVRPNVDQNRRQEIKAEYESALSRAMSEDRDRVPSRLVPDLSSYYR